ncbi:MAG TPA: ATP-binding protein, partial [Solirubrobacter sp.]
MGGRDITAGRLYGRENELEALRGVLDSASAGGGAMLLRGDAGIGKSAILAALAEHAAGLGM